MKNFELSVEIPENIDQQDLLDTVSPDLLSSDNKKATILALKRSNIFDSEKYLKNKVAKNFIIMTLIRGSKHQRQISQRETRNKLLARWKENIK